MNFSKMSLFSVLGILIGSGVGDAAFGAESQATQLTPGQFYFDCDAMPARLSRSSVKLSAEILSVEAEIRIGGFRKHRKWAPMARVILSNDKRENVLSVSVQYSKKEDLLKARVYFPSKGETKISNFGEPLSIDRVIPISIRFEPEGDQFRAYFEAEDDGKERSLLVPELPTVLGGSCSTIWSEINVKSYHLAE